MNLDASATFEFGNEAALRAFFLDHRTVHDQTAAALSSQFGGAFSTFGLGSGSAEDEWAMLMRKHERQETPALRDWLLYHAQMHNITYQTLNGTGTVAPDLSVVDFSKPEQFYDWMYVHQQMHDYEQGQLGLT